MSIKHSFILLTLVLIVVVQAKAQTFKYTYNGVTITYSVLSVPKHEVGVNYVPKDVVNVKVPAVVYFNGESFKVTSILEGGNRKDLVDYLFHIDYEYDNYAFSGCRLLKSVELPNTIKRINSYAFMGCSWLRSINIPSGTKVIESEAFTGCESLKSITIPSGLEVIGYRAFSYCESLKSVNIPSSIKEIGEDAFYGCSSLSSIIIPKQIGFTWKDTIILTPKGSKDISFSVSAFGSKRKVLDYDEFRTQVLSSPEYYLRNTYSKSIASMVKKILIDVGMYKEVLTFYPNDVEVQNLHREAEVHRLVNQGDGDMDKGNYTEAKRYYEQALLLTPNDSIIENKIRITDVAIAERERLRRETEEKARRENEKRQVELVVDDNMQVANWYLRNNQLQLASNYLQKAIDTTYQCDYDYRREEIFKLLNHIQELQKPLADTSNVLPYLTYRQDLYLTTDSILKLKIRDFLSDRNKKVKRNHISITLYSGKQSGSFQIEESTKMLKRMCEEVLEVMKLQPMIIDNRQWNSVASYDYDIEYASGILIVQQRNRFPQLNIKFEISSRLESELAKVLKARLRTLPSSCYGDYKFKVNSMDVGGQIEHQLELKNLYSLNGPQNAWRSMLVPGWGDKYVNDDRRFGVLKTVVSYGATLLGIGLYTGLIPTYIGENEVNSNAKKVGIGCGITGLVVWTYDVVSVWIKGAKNKKENKKMIGSMSFLYDTTQNTLDSDY